VSPLLSHISRDRGDKFVEDTLSTARGKYAAGLT